MHYIFDIVAVLQTVISDKGAIKLSAPHTTLFSFNLTRQYCDHSGHRQYNKWTRGLIDKLMSAVNSNVEAFLKDVSDHYLNFFTIFFLRQDLSITKQL